jgi:hypothetical protein
MLSTRSEESRVYRAHRDGRFHRSGRKRFHHLLVGDLTLFYWRLEPPADPGRAIVSCLAEPGSPSEAALEELGRWTETRSKMTEVAAGDVS